MKVVRRFHSKVDTSGKCWNWTAGKDAYGYGQFSLDGKPQKAHRVAYELAHGTLDESLLICHTCDNRSCVKPSHLFTGTHKDNTSDMYSKGRECAPPHKQGSAHGCAKLTEADIPGIRDRLKEGLTQVEIAKEYNISRSQIGAIKNGKNWRHVK